jgi:hypothetical protein
MFVKSIMRAYPAIVFASFKTPKMSIPVGTLLCSCFVMFFESSVLEFKRNYTEGTTGGDLPCRFFKARLNVGVVDVEM